MAAAVAAFVVIRLLGGGSTDATAMEVTSIGEGPAGTLRLPQALAVTAGDEVVAGDQFSGVLTRFDRNGKALGTIPIPPDPGIGIPAAGGVQPISGGEYLVADSTASRVTRIDSAGRVLTEYKAGRLHFGYTQYIGGLAGGDVITAHGKVVVADSANDRIVIFEMGGKLVRSLRLPGRISLPQGIAESPKGIYVADDLGNRVYEMSMTGEVLRRSRLGSHRLNHPYDVAVAPNGQVVVADNSNHAVMVLDRRLRWVRSFGREGTGPGRLRFPRAVAVDSRSRVLVADTANSRIAVFSLTGRWLGALGVDGRRPDLVTAPVGLTASSHGEIRVADGVTDRVTRYALDGRLLGTMGASQAVTDPVRRDGAFAGIDGLAGVGDGDVLTMDGFGLERFGADGQVRPSDGLIARLHAVSPGISAIGARSDGGVIAIGRSAGKPAVIVVDSAMGATARVLPAAGSPKWSAVADAGDGTAWAVSRSPGMAVHLAANGDVLAAVQLPSDPVTNRSGYHGPVEGPSGVAVDAGGGAWVSNAYTATVVRLSSDGTETGSVGGPGRGPGQLLTPLSVTVDCAGGVVVGDAGNARLQRFTGVAPAGTCGSALPPIPGGSPTRLGVDLHTRVLRSTSRSVTWRVTCSRGCTITADPAMSVEYDLEQAIAEHRKPVLSEPVAVAAQRTVRQSSSTAWTVTVSAPASRIAAARSRAAKPSHTRARAHVDASDANGLHSTVDLGARVRG